MRPETKPVCPLGVTEEMLSAWRDDLLEAAEAERIRQHFPTCPVCQQQDQDFGRIAALMRNQRELDPGTRVWQGVQDRIARPQRRWSTQPLLRSSFFSGLAAVLTVLLVVVLFARLLSSHATILAPVPTSGVSTGTATTTVGAMTTPAAGFSVADPALARQISFAYVMNGTLWVGFRGAPPRSVAHLDTTHVDTTSGLLTWALSWAPDQTRLLISEVDYTVSGAAHAWILSLPADTLTPLPAAGAAAALGCTQYCAWLEDRYLLYSTNIGGPTHYDTVGFYDTLAQRVVPTRLDKQPISEVEVRGTQVYFTPYALSGGSPGASGTAVINRFDITSNQITTVIQLPGTPVDENRLEGMWDLSADAHQVVASLCSPQPYCATYYQNTSGRVVPIFPGIHAQEGYWSRVAIAPQGDHVAGLVITSSGPTQGTTYVLVQQAVPAGSAITSMPPANSVEQDERLLGWSVQPLGIFFQQAPVDDLVTSQVTTVWFAAVGTAQPPVLVETITKATGITLAFAPTDGVTHAEGVLG